VNAFVVVSCGEVQVFISEDAWPLPRQQTGIIEFYMPELGWSKLQLEEASGSHQIV
jgi:hypothetical protein